MPVMCGLQSGLGSISQKLGSSSFAVVDPEWIAVNSFAVMSSSSHVPVAINCAVSRPNSSEHFAAEERGTNDEPEVIPAAVVVDLIDADGV